MITLIIFFVNCFIKKDVLYLLNKIDRKNYKFLIMMPKEYLTEEKIIAFEQLAII